ncbi:MAG: response regulator [Bacteroidota bacterium]
MNFAPSTSASERRAQVGAMLRVADRYIRDGKINEAREELVKIRELEPQNAYAMAFKERIAALEREKLKPKTVSSQNKSSEADNDHSHPDSTWGAEQPATVLVTRKEMVAKLEDEYKQKFALEIKNAEQRVADSVRAGEEKLTAERAELLAQLELERTQFKEQMQASFKDKLGQELKNTEIRLRKEYEEQKKLTEEEIRAKIEATFKLRLTEIDIAAEEERAELGKKEEQALAQMKTDMEEEFSRRLTIELDKVKQSTQMNSEKTVREQVQKEYEARLAQERGAIEVKYQSLQGQMETLFKAKQQIVMEESQRQLEQKIAEVRKAEEQKFVQEKENYHHTLEMEHEQKLQAMLASERNKLEETSKKAVDSAHAEFEKERARLIEDEQRKLEDLRAKLKHQMESELGENLERATEQISRNFDQKMSMLGIEVPKTKEQKIQIYRNRVRDAWANGPLTMEKAQYLMNLQDILQIGFDDHTECETEVRLQLYADTVQQDIMSGKIKPNDLKALEDLKLRFDITGDEEANVEPLILSAFRRVAVKAVILVADDDGALVDIIKQRLQELSYSAIGVATLAEAMSIVETTPVDLILSDIQFKGEKGDGFTFFKFVQQKPHLRKIPFILMSSLDEGLFIRTGVQLGVDDYLTKPLDLDLLVAVIEGKLKKYRTLNN